MVMLFIEIGSHYLRSGVLMHHVTLLLSVYHVAYRLAELAANYEQRWDESTMVSCLQCQQKDQKSSRSKHFGTIDQRRYSM